MKEVIENNYYLSVDSYNNESDLFSFKSNNEYYIFTFYNRTISELEELYNCTLELNKLNIKTLNFIVNKKGQILTKIENDLYVLLKMPNNFKEEVDLPEMVNNIKKLSLGDKYKKIYRNNWAKMWANKLDYYEYQIHELGKDKKIVLDSFGYYEGLATNAIALVNNSILLNNDNDIKITFSHRRIFVPNYVINYYNPLSFIFDLSVRDIAEYIKNSFFQNKDSSLELITFLKSVKLSNFEYNMFYARLLYPSYYFDIYDKVMENKLNQNELVKIISKANDYELFLKKAYLELSKYAYIEPVEWILNLKEY